MDFRTIAPLIAGGIVGLISLLLPVQLTLALIIGGMGWFFLRNWIEAEIADARLRQLKTLSRRRKPADPDPDE